MEIIKVQSYKISITFPWGERRQLFCDQVERDSDGTLRWKAVDTGLEPTLDCILTETKEMVSGWLGGTADTTVEISLA
jgi:hypothetical protein